jgi:hypothetical protein
VWVTKAELMEGSLLQQMQTTQSVHTLQKTTSSIHLHEPPALVLLGCAVEAPGVKYNQGRVAQPVALNQQLCVCGGGGQQTQQQRNRGVQESGMWSARPW